MSIDVEQLLADRLPVLRAKLSLASGVDTQDVVLRKPGALEVLNDVRRDIGVLADHQQLRMLVRIGVSELFFEDLKLLQASLDHDALTVRQAVDTLLLIPLCLEVQR